VASFGINLDLKLNGESALDRAVRGAKSLESIVKRLSDKPLDLNNIGGAARTAEGRLGKARTEVIEFAEAINKGEKELSKTEAGIREYISAFTQLAANTEAGTGTFNKFVGVIAKAEQQLDEIAHATENARRKALGLLSVEEEAAQLAQKAAQKKAKDDEAKARKRNEKAIDRENKQLEKLNKERKKEKDLAKQKRGRQIGDLAASIGFPLLFGGGVGSVAGGAIGSLAGSALGLGFGGQILGSAFGQQFDKASQAVTEFANAVSKASTSIDTLIEAVGVRGTATGTTARRAETLGIAPLARASLGSELESIIGEKGVDSLEKLSKSSDLAANSISKFGARLAAGFAPILTAVNETITNILGGAPEIQRLEQKREDLKGLKAAGSQGFAIERVEGEIARLEKAAAPALKERKELLDAIAGVERGQLDIAEKTTALEKSRLSARRDNLAVAQGNLQIDRLTEKLNIINLNLRGEITDEKRQELKLSKKLTEEEINAAKAARENARIEAERQIQREQISGATKQLGMLQKQRGMELQFYQIQQGRFNLFGEEMKGLKDKFAINKMTLNLENKRALIGVTEEERISSINREFELRRRLAVMQFAIDAARLEQAEAAFNLSEMQFEQELKLQNLKAATSAQQQIRQTSPFARETELLDPYFGGSRQLEIDQQIAFNEQLDLMKTKLKDVVEQQEIFALSPAVRRGLEQQEKNIKNQIANFKEYRPAIDEAALAQARFNEALAITVPVTDALFDNLLAVVEGTKTAEEAFADFLRSIASMLIDAAKQIIATYIAIGVARMFAGVSQGKGPDLSAIESYSGIGANTDVSAFIPGRASGGSVSAGRPYMVGERGPELFVPGASGNIVPNHAMGGANVTVNVDASGTQAQGNQPNAKLLGQAIGAAVQAELIKQKRPGGLLAA